MNIMPVIIISRTVATSYLYVLIQNHIDRITRKSEQRLTMKNGSADIFIQTSRSFAKKIRCY